MPYPIPLALPGKASQSLLNEVWFPTKSKVFKEYLAERGSQSLLNEVWFPTIGASFIIQLLRLCRNPF